MTRRDPESKEETFNLPDPVFRCKRVQTPTPGCHRPPRLTGEDAPCVPECQIPLVRGSNFRSSGSGVSRPNSVLRRRVGEGR